MRKLNDQEIFLLESQGCIAQDWSLVFVDDMDFDTANMHNVKLFGKIYLGANKGKIAISEGFERQCGIYNAILNDVSIGNDCLIENIMQHISLYDIADNVLIQNVGSISMSSPSYCGNGSLISVKNEAGEGNVYIFEKLTAQLAALQLRYKSIRELVRCEIESQELYHRGLIASNVRIISTKEISDTIINEGAEIVSASRIADCTIAEAFIGSDVILESCVVASCASILDGAKAYLCFIGEAAHLGKGFSAEKSLFFANSYMDNGEACAAFCGAFSVSHHKSSLLIGCETSFYNAGSNTNYSNHAYKLGAIHYGTLERGCKSASGSHVLFPAHIGAFSMLMGKIASHPNTIDLPFSYLFGDGKHTILIPAINLCSCGTYRDISKWQKRDKRAIEARADLINYDWLNPFVVQHIVRGKAILNELLNADNEDQDMLPYKGCLIPKRSILRGIEYYDLAIRMSGYDIESLEERWIDLGGMIAREQDIERICYQASCSNELLFMLNDLHNDYMSHEMNEIARNEWLDLIKQDAIKEYQMGDMEDALLQSFLDSL